MEGMVATSALTRVALGSAVLAAVLWPFSYTWVVVSLLRAGDPPWLFPVTIVAEMGSLAAGLFALLAGVLARRRPIDPRDRRRSGIAAVIGGAVAILVVGLNVLFLLILPH